MLPGEETGGPGAFQFCYEVAADYFSAKPGYISLKKLYRVMQYFEGIHAIKLYTEFTQTGVKMTV